jgi:hypothetical protein
MPGLEGEPPGAGYLGLDTLDCGSVSTFVRAADTAAFTGLVT